MTNPVFKPTYQHILEDDVIDATTDRRPSLIRDQKNAKMLLQQCSNETGQSIYGHLSEIIKRIIVERPVNVIDYFEDFSRIIREENYQTNEQNDFHQETYIESERLLAAKKILPILSLPPQEVFPGVLSAEPNDDKSDIASVVTNQKTKPIIIQDVIHLQFYWQLAGFAFSAGQTYLLSCAMRKLETNSIIRTCRFWGQLYGLTQNYYIIETELTEEEVQRRVLVETQQNQEDLIKWKQNLIDEKNNWLLNIDKKLIPIKPTVSKNDDEIRPRIKHFVEPPPMPRSMYKIKRDIPSEFTGNGVNQRIYFVCNNLGDDWIELPNVTPKQIQISRQIRKFLTGNLESEIVSFPVFPGVEKNLLRALIARITASNYVAPVKFYRLSSSNSAGDGNSDDDDEEEEEEQEDEDDNDEDDNAAQHAIPNPKYKPINIEKLLLPESWAHYRPNILKQGRTIWFNPKELINDKDSNDKNDEAEEEEEDEEEEDDDSEDENDDKNEKSEESIEKGPLLLTLCSQDNINNDELGISCPWTIRLSQKYNPNKAMVIIRSNLWPGAFSFALENVHDSIYFGWGSKFVTRNFSPNVMLQLPPIQDEYPLGPEIMEINDPTVDAEEIWRLAHTKNSVEMIINEEEEEEEDEGEGEDEPDDV